MNEKIESIYAFHIPRWHELPNVDLYLEQVVNFINSTLAPITFQSAACKENDEKLLTKTMINNYVKNNLLAAPKKKLYSKIHISKLFVICILKQSYSMNEINLLTKLTLKDSSIIKTYNNFCNLFEESLKCAFEKKDFIESSSNENNLYLIKSILLSCSYKIYTQFILNNK